MQSGTKPKPNKIEKETATLILQELLKLKEGVKDCTKDVKENLQALFATKLTQ